MTGKMQKDTLDRIHGTMYGNCVGDAIGLLTEFMVKDEVKEHYKNKHFEFADKVPDVHRVRWEIGDWTDDSDQMLLIMRSLIELKKVDALDFALKLDFWKKKGYPELGDKGGGMGIGATTSKVTSHPDYKIDPHKCAYEVWDASQRRPAPNGAVMRTSILGLYESDDIDKVIKNTLEICKTTHADPRCQASCVAVTTAIAYMVQRQHQHLNRFGSFNVEKIMESSFAHAKACLPEEFDPDELRKHMFAKHLKDLQLDEAGKIGYTYKCLGAGFWALQQKDFRKALEKIVRHAGDADTNGAVAGALLGCKLGSEAIPKSWLNNLKHKDWLDDQLKQFVSFLDEEVESQATGDD